MKEFIQKHWKRYLIYLLRWQGSTPLLAWCVIVFATLGTTWATIIANLIGGLIFYWIDRVIFLYQNQVPIWYIQEDATCFDCGKKGRGYRLVRATKYDKIDDPNPEWRCEICSDNKYKEFKKLNK